MLTRIGTSASILATDCAAGNLVRCRELIRQRIAAQKAEEEAAKSHANQELENDDLERMIKDMGQAALRSADPGYF